MIESVQTLLESVLQKYRSLETPDFSFVSKAISSKPYNSLINEMSEVFEIEEITDLNEDVSFRYVVSGSEKKWVIELSMLGLYAVILRIPEAGSVTLLSSPMCEQEERIISLLAIYQFEILHQQVLDKPIALSLCNTEPGNVFIYQALFSDTEVLPWKG